jgi:predicted transcriptional regulator
MDRMAPLSHIMQRVNLTSEQTKAFLNYLIGREMIERRFLERSERCLYRTTPRGIEYLKLASLMTDLFRTQK